MKGKERCVCVVVFPAVGLSSSPGQEVDPLEDADPAPLQALCAVDPTFRPYTVTSAAPVQTAFDTAAVLRRVGDTESPPLALPAPRPTVSDIRTLLARPEPLRHATAVSAAHDVDSPAVDP